MALHPPPILPTYVRTKAEALELVERLAPPLRAAITEMVTRTPPVTFPRYSLNYEMQERLRAVFEWLLDDRTRVYKRARFHLFYNLAERTLAMVDENGFQKALDHDRERFDREFAQRRAAYTVAGDGSHI